ncbi:serine-rich adhesin for platelets-like [Anopheles funestus]|uniref:BZIP domain-containing protein n=1 Tax=Anopheles funestus TaxID=62324 RepID=A0A182R9J0_ANOFN|nr:serine-rich adhesin for platelets-like [Anopheles funestus]XP_049288137.1 serine-rich adhesin for platelets-like [Anopheles funestus]
MNTTTMLESCSPTPSGPPVEHAPWWSAHSDSLFPEVEEDDCDVRALVPGKGRVDVERNRATTGERFLGDARKTAADACRIEFDTTASFSGAEESVTVHDVCNKTIRSSSSSSRNDSNRGCSGQFSSGARSHVASGSCNGSGTVAAASSSGATVAILGQQQQQHQTNSSKKPCDYSSISVSSSSNSNRGGPGINSASGSRPFVAPISPTLAAAGTGDHAMVTAPTSALPDIDWTNETCLAGGLDFTNTIVDDPRHLWLNSPTTSSSGSNITDTELERSLDEYHRTARGQSKPIETSIDCANLLDELHVELSEPPVTISPTVSLHEEIEQLSSAFDCDASNHLVSTTVPAIATLPFLGLPVDGTEPIPLNFFKWLQEDISSINVPARPELRSASSEVIESLLTGTSDATAHFYKPGQEISTTAHSTSDSSFEQSLDQIHNINGLTRDVSSKTTTITGRRHGNCTTATASSTTTATTTTTTTTLTIPNTANHSQRDHNYYAMKRRMQEEDIGQEGTPTKVSKLNQPIGNSWTMHDEKFSTPSTPGQPATASSSDSCKQHSHTKQPAVNTTTAVGRMERKLSLASRKAPTLAVNVTPRINLPAAASLGVVGQHQPSSTISGQTLAAAAALLPANILTSTATTTTTSTTTTTHEPLRIPSQAATLNTPDLTNDILDLEDEKFDLLSFIDTNDEALGFSSYPATVEEKPTLDLLPSPSATYTERHKTSADHGERSRTLSSSTRATPGTSSSKGDTKKQIYQLLTLDNLCQLTSDSDDSRSRAATTTGGRRTNTSSACSIGSRSSASSVCGDSSSDISSGNKAPKRRGRPPKVAGTVRDRSQYQHLSEADWRYREQRDKNNEASRKSRINRKDREMKLEMEADQLSAQHQKLSYEERRLQQDCQRWRKAVMKLALL